jgi:hypothetical protein
MLHYIMLCYINFQIVQLGHNGTYYYGPGFLFHCAPAFVVIFYFSSSSETVILHHEYLVLCILYLRMCSSIDVEFN